jgi:Restriction endonuclease
MYAFTYLTADGMDITYQVMVYDSTKDAYKMLMDSLPDLFKEYDVDEEYPSEELLEELEEQCRSSYFCGEMVPPYEGRDIIHILKYYAQFDETPRFYTFDDIDKNKLDISIIAKHIVDEDMGPRKKSEYLESIWNNNDNIMLRLFFGRKIYFIKQLDLEILKITDKNIFIEENNVKYGKRSIEDMSLSEIGKIAPNIEKELRDKTFEASLNEKGMYECAICKRAFSNRIPFQIDHIIPMNKGGKTLANNLQVLCRQCNGLKSDN